MYTSVKNGQPVEVVADHGERLGGLADALGDQLGHPLVQPPVALAQVADQLGRSPASPIPATIRSVTRSPR